MKPWWRKYKLIKIYLSVITTVISRNLVYHCIRMVSYGTLEGNSSPSLLFPSCGACNRLVCYVFHFRPRDAPHGNLPFDFVITYAYICTCIRRHLKETIPSSSITWSEMEKQNIQAKAVFNVREEGSFRLTPRVTFSSP